MVAMALVGCVLVAGVVFADRGGGSGVRTGTGVAGGGVKGRTGSAVGDRGGSAGNASSATSARSSSASATAAATTTTTTTVTLPDDGKTSDQRTMSEVTTITGDISPKSVVASGPVVFAQNMMYRHTMTVYDARTHQLLKTIPDSVDLAAFGITGHPGTVRGAPVEAAFTHDGRYVYVSQYQMYGAGFDHPGEDSCSPADGYDASFVYRVDTTTLEIDQVIPVGAVPKFLAVTPDDTRLLVSNWCDYDLSVVDTATRQTLTRVKLGRYPRGIVVSADSKRAYVAVMGSTEIAEIDLADYSVTKIAVGSGPRHLVTDRTGTFLYVTLNKEGRVAKVDPATRKVVAKVASPVQPRSMAISDDGTSLYVVNYESDAVSKIRTSDMTQVQRIPVGHHPIGITYNPATREVWVALYSGAIVVFADR